MFVLAITLMVGLAHYDRYYIPAGSMKPTLLVGDYIIVDRFAYGLYCGTPCGGKRIWTVLPKRGDVIVFQHPTKEVVFIKRLVGLPGDRVQITDGVIILNDVAVKQEANGVFEEEFAQQGFGVGYPRCSNPVGAGGICSKEQMTEVLPNGASYSILNIGEQPKDDTDIYTVPEGHYFFMGDNRDNSADSRFAQSAGGIGFVPLRNLIGRADRVVFSSAGDSLLSIWAWRKGRYQRPIK